MSTAYKTQLLHNSYNYNHNNNNNNNYYYYDYNNSEVLHLMYKGKIKTLRVQSIRVHCLDDRTMTKTAA